jgi:hypothetical protein
LPLAKVSLTNMYSVGSVLIDKGTRVKRIIATVGIAESNQLESSNKLVEDGQSDKTELFRLLSDDNVDFP